MNVVSQQGPIIWTAVSIGAIALVTLVIGFTLLLGTLRHRKVGLPMVWISASILIAALTAVILILTNSRG
ncbi:MAG TPA: hypothetical protein VK530_06065 [Candidatus Acidoferrum sp.]|nr:hypothetical protein [Candidatus Acidoferrum sp.]